MPRKVLINDDFFDVWSPEMAWVLGVVFTDGHFGKSNAKGIRRLYIAQKEIELLEKIKALMRSEHKIIKNTQSDKINTIYYLSFTNDKIYASLLRLGLVPKKSLILKFPNIPDEYLRHFLRGCWDGDGSFYYENGNPKRIRGDYVSGSFEFLNAFVDNLKKLSGIENIAVHKKHNNPRCFYIKLSPKATIKLFPIFYDNVPETMYLISKYETLKRSYEILKQNSGKGDNIG